MEIKVPKTLALGFTLLRSLKFRWSERTVEKSTARVYQRIGISRFGSRKDKFLDIAITEIMIGSIPKRES
jgi:hypothetical protein